MKFEWDENKNHSDDEMEIPTLTEKDFKNMVKNPYADKFTPEEKFRAYVEAFMADYGWDKEYVKKEVDLAVA